MITLKAIHKASKAKTEMPIQVTFPTGARILMTKDNYFLPENCKLTLFTLGVPRYSPKLSR